MSLKLLILLQSSKSWHNHVEGTQYKTLFQYFCLPQPHSMTMRFYESTLLKYTICSFLETFSIQTIHESANSNNLDSTCAKLGTLNRALASVFAKTLAIASQDFLVRTFRKCSTSVVVYSMRACMAILLVE